jgi:preprotein translocase subunit SecF
MFELIKKPNLNFIGKRYYAFVFSAIVVILGLIAFVLLTLGRGNLGIDFSGGTMVQGNFAKPVSIGELRSAMSKNGYKDAFIQSLQRDIPNSFVIRVKKSGEKEVRIAQEILSILQKEFPNNPFHNDSVDEIGPAVGKLLQKQARWAVLIAAGMILLYIWIRFDFRFGVAATIATIHDVLVMLGFVWITQREMTLLTVTAILTIAGYSLTDTVVVFDRIRENLKTFRKKGDFPSAVNSSINEVLSRTIITSLTTLLSALAIYLFAGEVVRDFALVLFVGIMIGTYSSIFVASPILVEWEARSPKRFK